MLHGARNITITGKLTIARKEHFSKDAESQPVNRN